MDVIWPIDNIIPHEQEIKLLNSSSVKNTRIRKWNDDECEDLSWDYTGSNIKIFLTSKSVSILCPIISISPADREKLPYNSCSITVSSEKFSDEIDRTIYATAKVYDRDPYTRPLPSSMTSSMTPSMTSSIPKIKSLPTHVSKLVLADSISKNECCPITCDLITMENGYVTSCGHVFTKASIKQWLTFQSSKSECPMCKEVCR